MVAFTPVTDAAISSKNLNSLVESCLDTDDGDAGRVRVLISKYADEHFDFTASDAKKVIKILKRKRKKFQNDVTEEDLDRVYKHLKDKIERLMLARNASGSTQGSLNLPTSIVTP